MAQDINKPTGNGYQGTWTRKCTICGHGDLSHYGKMGCLCGDCRCLGPAFRDLSYEEIEIIRNPPIPDETKYLGEAFDSDLQAEIRRQKNAPIPKLPELTKAEIQRSQEALRQHDG